MISFKVSIYIIQFHMNFEHCNIEEYGKYSSKSKLGFIVYGWMWNILQAPT